MLRFGFDLGTNSIGWCVFETENGIPVRLRAANSRIFSDGREPDRDKKPLAVACRLARGARVRRDRMISRKKLLLKKLLELGLMPPDETERQALKLLNPYELRAKAVTTALAPHELGRVLMNLAQRRGFKSNRKSDSKEDAKKTQPDLDALAKALTESGLTLGQYLWQERLEKNKPTRARSGEGLYPQRQQYEDEFKIIRSMQTPHHPKVLRGDWNEIFDELFFHRPLREQEVGYCQVYFEQNEKRAPTALPSYQKFRIAQNIANLQIISPDRGSKKRLDLQQRHLLAGFLQEKGPRNFSAIRKLLKLQEGETFNLETERKKKLEGNETAALLSDKKHFGKIWFDLSDADQDAIASYLLNADKSAIIQKAEQDWKLSAEQANNLATLTPEDFPKGYARFGHRALRELVEKLTEQGISTTEAIMELRGKRGDNSVRHDRLLYYGKIMPEFMILSPKRGDDNTKQYGKINNPTVHIGLNQIRKLVNELIDTYGAPDEIFLELARELKLNSKAKDELEKFQKKNQRLNDEAKLHMQESDITPNDEKIKKYKLWKELASGVNDRCCPYSGKPISIAALWSDIIEVEHILPEAKTFDSSMKNLTVAYREANRAKGNYAPADAPAFSSSYQDILDRVQRSAMSPGKKRKFDPGAMKSFTDDPKNGFIARQMTDTQYLAKMARKYLLAVCGQVHVLPGQLTARIRYDWGLNALLWPADATKEEREQKNRNDHRHHAIDAVVIACTDRIMLQKASAASGRDGRDWSVHFDPPWERDRFRRDVADVMDKAIVSHKPDRGIQGRLHKDTNYGIIASPNEYERNENFNLVVRKDFKAHFSDATPIPVEGKKKKDGSEKIDAKDIRNKIAVIRDPTIRHELENLLLGLRTTEEIAAKAIEYATTTSRLHGLRRIRLLDKNTSISQFKTKSAFTKEFGDSTANHAGRGVIPEETHHIAFWRVPANFNPAKNKSPLTPKPLRCDPSIWWVACNIMEANSVHNPDLFKPHPAARLVCKLHKNDLVKIVHDGEEKICIVKSIAPSESNKKITMCEHMVASGGDFSITFNQVKNCKLRKIHITPAGKIHDPGSMF